MKLRNLFTLLVVALVSVSILFGQTETKKTDAAKEKQKSCCPSDKAVKIETKAEGKTSVCTSKDATHKHDDSSDCMKKETTKAMEKETQMKGDIYGCSMCPSVRSDKPGKCPECGMSLKKMKPSDKITAMYSCPMHPEITSDKEGKCSKCGMALEKIKTSDKETKVEKHSKMSHDVYGCPMCPSVKSDKPDKCPKCGMDLEKIKKGN